MQPKNIISRVFDFNAHVVGIQPRLLSPLDPNEKKWLVGVLHEEALELGDSNTLVDDVDALVDSVIFALGGLYRLGLTEQQAQACIHAVMDANCEKKPGQKSGREVSGVKDAVKPKNWVGPEQRIKEILENV